MKQLFSNKVFRIIMATDFIQQMCIWIRNLAVLLFIIDKTNADPIFVSLVAVFEYLPMFVFSYIGGTLADRWNPKKTMILGDFLSAISIVAILFFVSKGIWQAIFVVTFISAVVTQFSVPSSVIMFKKNIDDALVTPAISLSQALQSLYIIVGPIIGTLFYMSLGVEFSLITIAILFLISSGIQFLLPAARRKPVRERGNLKRDMLQGLRFIKTNSGVKTISVILFIIGLAQGLIQPLTIYILNDRLQLGKEALQWFFAISGAGLLAGAVLSAAIGSKLNTRTVLFAMLLLFSAFTVIEVLSANVVLTAAMYFLSGTAVAFIQVAVSAPLIKNVPEDMIGRVNGLITPLLMGGVLIGSGFAGIAFKMLSLLPVYLISAGFMLLSSLVSLRYRESSQANDTSAAPLE